MSKAVVLLPLAFVAGGLIGYWNNAEEVRALKTREKTEERAKPKAARADGFGSFAQLVNIPAAAKAPRKSAVAAKGAEAPKPAEAAQKDGGKGAAEEALPARKPVRELDPEDLRARIDEAAELWRTRVDIAKGAAVQKLGLDADGEARFDAALGEMNDRLRDSMQAIADALANEEEMTPEIGVRLMGDLATTLAEAYDGVGACVDESRRGEVARLMLVEFVDPSVAEPLIGVQDKLDGGFFPGGRRK